MLGVAAISEVSILLEVNTLEERLPRMSEVGSLGGKALDVGSSELDASDMLESTLPSLEVLVAVLLRTESLLVALDRSSLAVVVNEGSVSELVGSANPLVNVSGSKLLDNPVGVAAAALDVDELFVALTRGGGSVTRRKSKQSPGIAPTTATKTGWAAGSSVQM